MQTQKVKDKLSQFLLQAAGREFKSGQWVCGFMLADWYMYSTGKPDPVAQYRGQDYPMDSAFEHIHNVCTEIGLQETRHPRRGDIGIIDIPDKTNGGKQTFGAIFSGRRWILLAHTGISGISPGSVTLNKAWRIQ